MNELQRFYENIEQDVISMVASAEDGASPESKFTEYMADLLVQAGETENVAICTEIKEDKAGRRVHKINAYALSETYETVDLFISVYKTAENVETIAKDEIITHCNLAKRFLNDALKDKFLTEMEESAPAYDLAQILSKYYKDIIRVNIFVMTNGTSNAEAPKESEIEFKDHAILVQFQIWDLERFYQLYTSKNKREAIEIDFQNNFGGAVACLPMPSENENYQSYLAIISGETLANIYRNFGARLLEQNVRSFLQFTGKINKGIRETIKREPQMFLAFNNGIASTAEYVELIDLENGSKGIAKVKDFQIVNGGQTTASIFHSQKQDKSDVSKIFVQVKLTVVKKKDEFANIVSRIAEYANSQNKVSVADLSSNNPFHIELEKLSRVIWAPDPTKQNKQTRWFYERARGQYKNEMNKEGTTASRKKVFELKNPKSQLFQKETLAKFYNAWNGSPHFVAKGSQKNYIEFFKNIPKILKDNKGLPDNIFFENVVAMAILFRTAEKSYGLGQNSMGDLRFMVVPYTLSYLNKITNGKIDLFKIWKNQAVSENLKLVITELLEKVQEFLKTSVGQYGGLIGEWAKKETCWELLEKTVLKVDTSSLQDDFTDEKLSKRQKKEVSEVEELAKQAQIEELKAIPSGLWKKIAAWGKTTEKLTLYRLNLIEEISRKIKTKTTFEEKHIASGLEILAIAFENAPELFLDNEEDVIVEQETLAIEITKELIENLLIWQKKQHFFNATDFNFVKKIKANDYIPTDYQKKYLLAIIQKAKKGGFKV
jgi:hypothetical protein